MYLPSSMFAFLTCHILSWLLLYFVPCLSFTRSTCFTSYHPFLFFILLRSTGAPSHMFYIFESWHSTHPLPILFFLLFLAVLAPLLICSALFFSFSIYPLPFLFFLSSGSICVRSLMLYIFEFDMPPPTSFICIDPHSIYAFVM